MTIPVLQAIDRSLLRRLPNLWCLRMHYVVPGVVAGCFLAAYVGHRLRSTFVEADLRLLGVFTLLLCGAIGIYWCYLQARQRYTVIPTVGSDLLSLVAYPALIALLLVPAYVFDLSAGPPSRFGLPSTTTLWSDHVTFGFVAVLSSIAFAATWLFRTLTVKSVVTGVVAGVSLTIVLVMGAAMVDARWESTVQFLALSYGVFSAIALGALAFNRWPWAAAASVLFATGIGAILASQSNAEGYTVGIGGLVVTMVVCAFFMPFLSRYRTVPK